MIFHSACKQTRGITKVQILLWDIGPCVDFGDSKQDQELVFFHGRITCSDVTWCDGFTC